MQRVTVRAVETEWVPSADFSWETNVLPLSSVGELSCADPDLSNGKERIDPGANEASETERISESISGTDFDERMVLVGDNSTTWWITGTKQDINHVN